MGKKILVMYIGVATIRSEDIGTYTAEIAKKILPTTFHGEVIIIPIQSVDTRIECINPKYITETELIKENNEMLKKLKEQLDYQSKLLK